MWEAVEMPLAMLLAFMVPSEAGANVVRCQLSLGDGMVGVVPERRALRLAQRRMRQLGIEDLEHSQAPR